MLNFFYVSESKNYKSKFQPKPAQTELTRYDSNNVKINNKV